MATQREARLRPEFADRYPGIEPGLWFTAATLAEHLMVRIIRSAEHPDALPPRVLDPAHFDFRGEGPVAGARVTLGADE
jgi:hypothetical protein